MLLEAPRRALSVDSPPLKLVPLHDGHPRIDGADSDHFGYGGLKAGAVEYLLDFDESSIDHSGKSAQDFAA